jgi:acetyl-CoA carboxylase biotin carboxylase subunit
MMARTQRKLPRAAKQARSAIRKVLIANRGEIAVRIARACRSMQIGSVAVYSEADRAALHVHVADEATCIGPASPRESYLDIEAVIDAARRTGADAIHPGYGFLSENADFARRVRDAGIVFVGPSSEAIAAMGDKLVARGHAIAAGVPIVPGTELLVAPDRQDQGDVADVAATLGYPVLVKAAAGGGGRGMRIVASSVELAQALAAGTREAAVAFGDGRIYLEKYFAKPRHVEVQLLADHHGTIVHLGERECSIQRRHQKIIEESPAPHLSRALRTRLTEAAIAVARAVDYTSAGTVEFLVTPESQFYFLEMNTRLQVEHPVTEWVTGIDLVREQLRIAADEPLGYGQEDIHSRGAAIECRVYAEDAANGFLPSAGRILALNEPSGPGVRIDSGVAAGVTVPVEYDPLLAKLTTWGLTRDVAIERMRDTLVEMAVVGPETNIPFLRELVEDPAFRLGDTHTEFVTSFLAERGNSWTPDMAATQDAAAIVAALLLAADRDPRRFGTLQEVARGASSSDGAGRTALPAPWTTLGPWRLGGS